MNIIKFKDIYLDINDLPSGVDLTEIEVEMFNTELKGRYAYALNWMWVVPFSEMDITDFVAASQNNTPGTARAIGYDKIVTLMDEDMTERINSVEKYEYLNQFSSDDDITLEEVKRFRTWLAETLLVIKDEHSMIRGEREMLAYYAGGMYDQVVGNLTLFAETAGPQYSVVGTSTCGCSAGTSLSALTVGTSTCDPLYIYRRGIYDFMVQLWSKQSYWLDLESVEFLTDFKRYIDAVISYNLPLYTSDWTTVFSDCNCLNTSDSLQEAGISAMRNLSISIGYMISSDVVGHKNFIDNALRVFTTKYYEMMYWN